MMERRTAMKSAADIEETAAEWLVRREGEAWSDADQTAFDQWVAEETAHRIAVIRLETVWRKAGRLRASVLEKPDPVRAEPEAAPSNPFGLSLSKGRSVFSRGRGKRSEEHTSELQSLMRISYAVFCLKKKNTKQSTNI